MYARYSHWSKYKLARSHLTYSHKKQRAVIVSDGIILLDSSFTLFSAAPETLMAVHSLCSPSSLIYERRNYLSNFQLRVCASCRGTTVFSGSRLFTEQILRDW